MAFFDDLKASANQPPLTDTEQRILASKLFQEIKQNCSRHAQSGYHSLSCSYSWKIFGNQQDSRSFHIISNFYAGNYFAADADNTRCDAQEAANIQRYLQALLVQDGFPPDCVRTGHSTGIYGNKSFYTFSVFIKW